MMKDLSLYPTNYAELLDAHKKIHKELFERVSIDLGASKEDRMKSSEELLEAVVPIRLYREDFRCCTL